MGMGSACQEAPGRVFGPVWTRTEPFFRSKPGPLAGYPDPLLTVGPVQMASTPVFTTYPDVSSGGGVSQCAGSAEWLTYGNDRLWDLSVSSIAYIERLCDCFLSFLLLYRFMQPRGSASEEGNNVTARLHVTCPGQGNTLLSSSAHHQPEIASDNLTFIQLYNIDTHISTVSTDIPSYENIHGRIPLHSITASLSISKLAFSWPPSVLPNSLDRGVQVHLRSHFLTPSTWISKVARSNLPSASPSYSITASQWFSKLLLSCPPRASLSWKWSRPPSESLSY